MKERLKVLDFKYNVLTVFFIFILFISLLAPLSGNDWINYVNGKSGIIESFKNLTFNNGGLLSDFFAGIFTNSKGIFDILFASLMTFTFYNVIPLFGKVEKKTNYLLLPTLLLLVGVETFSFNFISVTGTVCYTFPALLILNYFLYLYKIGNNKFTIGNHIVLLLIILFVSLVTVHLSIAFLLANILFYAYKTISVKGYQKSYIALLFIHIFVSIISLFYVDKAMLFSSFEVLKDSIPTFIDEIFSKNILLIIIGMIPIDFYLNEKLGKHSFKRVLIVLFSLIPFLSLAYNFFNYSPVNLNLVINRYSGVFATENWYFIFYYIIYVVLFLLTVIHYISRVKTRNYLLLFLIAGLVCSALRILSPDYDFGSNILFLFAFMISTAVLYKEMDIKVNNKICVIVTILMTVYYLAIFGMCKYIDVSRNNYIKEQMDEGKTTIVVKSNPFYYVFRYNPNTIFQKRDFKKYMNIPENTKIEDQYFGVFKQIESKVKK